MPIALSSQHIITLCVHRVFAFSGRGIFLFSPQAFNHIYISHYRSCILKSDIELPSYTDRYNFPFRQVQAYIAELTNDISTWKAYLYIWWLYIPLLALRPDATLIPALAQHNHVLSPRNYAMLPQVASF